MINELLNSNIFTWVIMPLLIILARILDVGFGTLRLVFISKNKKLSSALLSFLESFVWIMVVGKLLSGSSNIVWLLAYALGFGIGTYLGLLISDKLAIGKVLLRVVTKREPKRLIKNLIEHEYKFTIIDAKNQKNNKTKILLLTIDAKNLKKVVNRINKFNPKAFYSIEEVKSVKEVQEYKKSSMIKSFFINPLKRFK